MMWVGFELAVEYVERQLGLSHGAAWKALIDGGIERNERGDVLDVDLDRWLQARQGRQPAGKQPRILRLLDEMFPGRRVPPPGECNRQQLITELLNRDRSLKSIDMKTLKKTIDKRNEGFPLAPLIGRR